MNKTLVFASNNAKKLKEIRAILSGYEIKSLKELGCEEDIPETAITFQGNAFLKAEYVFNKYGLPCFADDSGLVVEALNGEPGVYSARYAAAENGGEKSDEKNMDKLLQKLGENPHRNAYFISVICYYDGKQTQYFEGKIPGTITQEKMGEGGFGYDPIFIPNGSALTFAEMPDEEKNKNSHRSIALKKLMESNLF